MENKKSYKETLDFLYSQLPMFQRQGKAAFKKDLTNIKALCEYLGNPHQKIKTIHVAGTNGKGSVSHIIAAALQGNKLKTGLYTSPHYKDFRERIKINGKYISRKEVRDFVHHIEPVLHRIRPSFFEINVAMAFWYFEAQKCDIAVIETGLGGRLDSTNIIKPLLSIITNIGFDHQNMLGDTLILIATEKAGIIKDEIPVLIGEKQLEINKVFENKAEEKKSNIYYASDIIELTKRSGSEKSSKFLAPAFSQNEIEVDLIGPFVERNLKTSLASLRILSKYYPQLSIDRHKSTRALASIKSDVNYIGRWQYLSKPDEHPIIIADSAHNREGLEIAFSHLSRLSYRNLHIITGFVMEKDLNSIVDLFPEDAQYYFAKANIPRGMKTDVLKQSFQEEGRKGRSYVSTKNAFRAAKRNADSADLILIIGSIFIVAEVI